MVVVEEKKKKVRHDEEANREQTRKDHYAYCSSPYATVKIQGLHTLIPHTVLVHLSQDILELKTIQR